MIDFRTYDQNPYDRFLLVILVIVFELTISVFVDLNARAGVCYLDIFWFIFDIDLLELEALVFLCLQTKLGISLSTE